MQKFSCLIVPVTFALSACGSDPATGSPGNAPSETATFTPPKELDGYTRFRAMTVPDIQPGVDTTHCQYVMAPFDHDVDIVDVQGAQSKFGHHGVMFSYTPGAGEEVGAELPCMMGSNEFSASSTASGSGGGGTLGGSFLGSVGPVKGRSINLPDGVAFRLNKGQGIMLNLHYINTGTTVADGDAYLDVKFADVDPNRMIAALFLNLNMNFSIPPSTPTDSTGDCVAGSDVKIIMMGNHMHEYGTHASTEVVHGDTGALEVLRNDPEWTGDMVNNPTFATWDPQDPFILHAGDTIRTNCSWNNSTSDTIDFPREMCISAGFALATGDNPTAPACFNGSWFSVSGGVAP